MFPRRRRSVLGKKPRRRQEALMKNGKGPSATLGPDSELQHRCREGSNFSFAERETSSRDKLPQELVHLNGPNFWESLPADHT